MRYDARTSENFESFLRGFIDAVVWAGTVQVDDGIDECLTICFPDDYLDDIREVIRSENFDDVWNFFNGTCRWMHKATAAVKGTDAQKFERHGQDFALTSRGHGTGFWDRGYGKRGKKLAGIAETYGTSDNFYLDESGELQYFRG